tara:strand:+ start:430 stop:690 length:261 start_codon:yes stop_codon:yes gene_type:complete
MLTPEEKRREIMKAFKEDYVNYMESSFKDLVQFGPVRWTESYTLSYNDKIRQLDGMIDYFTECEEYEKCQYILDVKNNVDVSRYML